MVTSVSNSLRLEFNTDTSVQKSGFAALFFTGKYILLFLLKHNFHASCLLNQKKLAQTKMNVPSITADVNTSVKILSAPTHVPATMASSCMRTNMTAKKAAVHITSLLLLEK